MTDEEFEYVGYSHLRDIGGKICGLLSFISTTGLIVGMDESGYDRRYCYEYAADAIKALAEWDGGGHPGGPWVKVRGQEIDEFNPVLTA